MLTVSRSLTGATHLTRVKSFVGEKRCPKRHTATPTIRLPDAVDLNIGWASHDVIEGTIAKHAYIMHGERLSCVALRAGQVLYGSSIYP